MLKYILEGLAVSAAAHVISGGRRSIRDIVVLGLTAGAVFLILDIWAPGVSLGARQGSGFGLGAQMVGSNLGPAAGAVPRAVDTGAPALEAYGETGPKVGPLSPPAPEPLAPGIGASQASQGVMQDSSAYKLVAGEYSAQAALAGYNEDSEAYNTPSTAAMHSWPFADDNRPPGL